MFPISLKLPRPALPGDEFFEASQYYTTDIYMSHNEAKQFAKRLGLDIDVPLANRHGVNVITYSVCFNPGRKFLHAKLSFQQALFGPIECAIDKETAESLEHEFLIQVTDEVDRGFRLFSKFTTIFILGSCLLAGIVMLFELGTGNTPFHIVIAFECMFLCMAACALAIDGFWKSHYTLFSKFKSLMPLLIAVGFQVGFFYFLLQPHL